jgi:phosphoglycolate phosphatase
MKKYSAVVFDWDGTLMDSTHSIVTAIQGACRDLELPVPDDAQASWVIGLPFDPALRHAVPDLPESMKPYFLERFRTHYLVRDHQLKLFDGVEDMLDDLKAAGANLGVATGKNRIGLNRALTATSLHNYFTATRCADETFGKPHPGMLLELIDELLVPDPTDLLMVGDTSHDLNMAANAGVHGLGVTYGAHPEQELRACAHEGIVHDVSGLRVWLLDRITQS